MSKTWLSLLTLPQASSCDQNQSYNFQSTLTKSDGKKWLFPSAFDNFHQKRETKLPECTSRSNLWIVGLTLTQPFLGKGISLEVVGWRTHSEKKRKERWNFIIKGFIPGLWRHDQVQWVISFDTWSTWSEALVKHLDLTRIDVLSFYIGIRKYINGWLFSLGPDGHLSTWNCSSSNLHRWVINGR